MTLSAHHVAVICLAAVVMIVLGIGLARHRPLWGMFVLMTVLMVLLVKPLDRYFLPLVPLLVFAWWQAIAWVNHRLPARWANKAFLLLFALGALPNGARVGGFILEQRQAPFRASYKEGRYASADGAARMIAAHVPDGGGEATSPATAWVLVPPKFGRIMTYLSRRYAVELEETDLDPFNQRTFVLEPSDPPAHDPPEPRPPVHAWLAKHDLAVWPDPVAETPNKDPHARAPWTLHRVVPAALLATTRPGQ